MAELERRVKEIVSSKFWAKHTPLNEPPRIKDGRGCRWARGSKWFIVMPKWARSEAVLIHELTHTLLYRKYPGHFGGKNYEYMAGHGWEFAELYLKMVRRSEEHTSELQSRENIVCRLLREKKNKMKI